jgi:hypothetical protein
MKRTTQVMLVLMGTAAVGGGAYWLSSRDCKVAPQGGVTPEQCRSGSTGGGGGAGYRPGQDSSPSSHNTSTTQRGGFGGFGHAFSGGS